LRSFYHKRKRGLVRDAVPSEVPLVRGFHLPLCIADLQQEGGLSEERPPKGPPERVCDCCERTHQHLLFPGKQCEAPEAAKGLKRQS
jgi:hypothetical protein